MNRRELLKPLAAVALTPLIVKGQEVGKSVAIEPETKTKYAIFVDGDMVDVYGLIDSLSGTFPPGTPLYAVLVPRGKTIDDAIRIFKVD